MTDLIEIHSHTEITVRRPNGEIEVVTKDSFQPWGKRQFDVAKKATAEAGRGELVSYTNITKMAEAPKPTDADLAEQEYRRSHDRIAGMAAGGESFERAGNLDNTPAHKSDF